MKHKKELAFQILAEGAIYIVKTHFEALGVNKLVTGKGFWVGLKTVKVERFGASRWYLRNDQN